MAAPHVAGAAALAKAAFPSATGVGLKDLLLATTDPKPSLATTTSSGGRLNVGSAVACNGTPQVWVDAPANGFAVDLGDAVPVSVIATTCGDPAGVSVTATANGASVTLTPRGDGLYTGSFTPPAGGSVTFSVTATVGGSSVTRNVAGNTRTALSITPGGPPVTVTSSGETVPVRFTGTAGARVSMALTNVTMGVGMVSLVQPSGASLASTFVASNGGFLDTTTLPVAGTYTINVAPLSGASGAMTLTLYDVPPDVTAPVTPGGSPASLSLTTPGQNGRFAFSASARQRISMQLSNMTFSFASISIRKPDGSMLSSRFIASASTFVDTSMLPVAGAYTILLDPQGAATGSGTITVYDVPPDVGGPINLGTPATVSTAVPGQNGRLTFAGNAGQRVTMKITASTYSAATATLLGPDGKAVGSSTYFGPSGGFVDVRTLPAAGTYALMVDPQSTATGSATVTLFDVPPDVAGTITPGGAPVSATMAIPGQNSKYTFAGTAGQRISLKIGPSTLPTAYLSITGPTGAAVGTNTLFSTSTTFVDTRVLPATGAYTLTVDPYNEATGSATLTLYDVPPDATASLAIGGPPQSISMTTPGQNGSATFSANAGQSVSLTLSGVTIPSSFVSILKPDGTALVPRTLVFSYGRTFVATAPVAGTYTVVVDPQGAVSGLMTLGVN
jgi:hypothetical protein